MKTFHCHAKNTVNVIQLHAKEICAEQLNEFSNQPNAQISQLARQVENITAEFNKYKESAKDVEFLQLENETRIEQLQSNNSKKQTEINNLKVKLDAMQHNDLETSIQVLLVGLPPPDKPREFREISASFE